MVTNTRAIKPSQDLDVLAVERDISQPATADRITGDAPTRSGRIDTLVNNAGVFVSNPFTSHTAQDHAPRASGRSDLRCQTLIKRGERSSPAHPQHEQHARVQVLTFSTKGNAGLSSPGAAGPNWSF